MHTEVSFTPGSNSRVFHLGKRACLYICFTHTQNCFWFGMCRGVRVEGIIMFENWIAWKRNRKPFWPHIMKWLEEWNGTEAQPISYTPWGRVPREEWHKVSATQSHIIHKGQGMLEAQRKKSWMRSWGSFCKMYWRRWELEQVKRKMDRAFPAGDRDRIESIRKGMEVKKKKIRHA